MALTWRSALTVMLPLGLGACAGDDSLQTSGDESSSSTEGPTTTSSIPDDTTTSPTPASSTGADDSSTGGGSSTTEPGTSTGPEATTEPMGGVSVCGNNVIEGDEMCDLNQLNGESCVSLGYQGGQLGCMLTCEDYNILGCYVCGNDMIDIVEDCENGVVPEEVTCASMGYPGGGWVTCGDDCLYDTSECSICGDGVQQGPEQCDGIDYAGETCASLGFDGGDLGCVIQSCAYDLTGCSGGMYIQDFEIGAVPPEFTVGGAQPFVVDGNNPIAGMFSAHSGAITHNQTSSLSISANYAVAGDISFWHEESSENNFDYLQFYIDGVMQDEWAGLNPAVQATYPVAPGNHDFEWRYDKDGSVNSNADTVWVDDITMVGGVPI